MDQVRTVVNRLQRHALGQAGGDFRELRFQVVDDVQRVLAVARHGDTGDHLAFTVQFHNAAAFIRRQFDPRHVSNQHRRTLFCLDHEILDVGNAT